jgi:hypothetical protein
LGKIKFVFQGLEKVGNYGGKEDGEIRRGDEKSVCGSCVSMVLCGDLGTKIIR